MKTSISLHRTTAQFKWFFSVRVRVRLAISRNRPTESYLQSKLMQYRRYKLHATESYLRSTLVQYSLLSHRRVAVSTFCVAFSDSPSYFCDHIVHHNNAQQSATLTFTLSGTTSQDFLYCGSLMLSPSKTRGYTAD